MANELSGSVTNSPVAMPDDGTSHFQSSPLMCAGLVKMAFWSSARFLKKYFSLGCGGCSVRLAAAGTGAEGSLSESALSTGCWATALSPSTAVTMTCTTTARNGNPGTLNAQFY